MCFEASCGFRSLEHRYSEQVDSKKSQIMRHGYSRESGVALVYKGSKETPPKNVQSVFSRLTCYRGTVPCSTLLQQSDNIPVASERQIQRFPAEHPMSVTDLGLELVGRMVTHDGCVKFGSQIESMVQTCCNW